MIQNRWRKLITVAQIPEEIRENSIYQSRDWYLSEEAKKSNDGKVVWLPFEDSIHHFWWFKDGEWVRMTPVDVTIYMKEGG